MTNVYTPNANTMDWVGKVLSDVLHCNIYVLHKTVPYPKVIVLL